VIDEPNDGMPTCRINLISLRQSFRDVQYLNGVLTFTYKGHRYKCYCLLVDSGCVHAEAVGNELIISIVASREREAPYLADTGSYGLMMIEDEFDCWVWDLSPAFPNSPIVFRGGPITKEEREKMEQDTTKKLNCFKEPGQTGPGL
jgi:hypothetical protein